MDVCSEKKFWELSIKICKNGVHKSGKVLLVGTEHLENAY